MGQHTSRPAVVEHTSPRSPLSQLPPSHAWPRWASSLTQGLPAEGERGLFRGEFMLVQAPMDGTMGRREESHPRSSHIFRHQFRSHTIALPGRNSSESFTPMQHPGTTRIAGHYQNRSVVRDVGPVHLTLPQSRGFTKSLRHQLGHITEEEEDVISDDVKLREKVDRRLTHIRSSARAGVGSGSVHREEEDDDAAGDDYSEDDDAVSASSDDHIGRVKVNSSASAEEGVPYHYFANHLVKPFFVTSQRYGSFQTMTARYRAPFPLPRPNVRISKSLPRAPKHMERRTPSRKGTTITNRNGFTTLDNGHTFEVPYMTHDFNDRTADIVSYSHSPRNWHAKTQTSDYDPYSDYTEVCTYPSPSKLYEDRRPSSPIQDYSSSESGISDDYRFASKTVKKHSSRNSEVIKTSSSDESNRLYKRRKSSSADSAMKDFDVLSSFSSDNDYEHGDDVFNAHTRSKTQGSPNSRGNIVRKDTRRVSDSSSNSSGRNKGGNFMRRKHGKGKRGNLEDRGTGNELTRKSNDSLNEDSVDNKDLRRQKKSIRAMKTLHLENTWPHLKSCLANDDYREMAVDTPLHNDSFLGASEMRRRSMPCRDESLDSDYGELNRTGKSSRSASHKSVAFADETLDTSLANSSSKNMSKSLADIINTSLTDGTFSTRKVFNRFKSVPADQSHETSSNKSSNQTVEHRDEKDESKENNAGTLSILLKPSLPTKSERSNSTDSFLSSSNCTDKIKKLQDILIKQALPFAKPDDLLLSAQSKKSNKVEVPKSNIDEPHNSAEHEDDRLNTYSQVPEMPEVKQHIWHSKSEGDLVINRKPLHDLRAKQAANSDIPTNKMPPATAISLNQSSVYENPLPAPHPPPPPPPPPPPAPPLPDFFKKGVASLKTSDVAAVSSQLDESKSKNNISIIKVNKTINRRQSVNEDRQKPVLKSTKTR